MGEHHENVPVFPGVWELAAANIVPGGTLSNLQSVEDITTWDSKIPEIAKKILADAQTSGGLLISIPRDNAKKILAELKIAGVKEAVLIGHFTEEKPLIRVRRKIAS